jgi:sugar phosphate isomerase/epimerase
MPILTLGWLTLLNTTPPDVITAAGQAGFKSVSIRITGRRLTDDYMPIVGNKANMQEIKRRMADGGLRMSNTSVYHMSPEITLEHLRPAIEATAELGAPIMVATCTDPDHARWTEFIAKVCEVANSFGIKVALEFVPFSQAKTIEAGYAIVQNSGAPNFGLLVDALHLSRSGGKPADIAKIDPARIIFAQLCDAVAERPQPDQLAQEARTGRLYPGDGALPLYDFLDALPSGIEIECEMPCVEYAKLSAAEQAMRAAEAARNYLKDYCDKRGKPAWT